MYKLISLKYFVSYLYKNQFIEIVTLYLFQILIYKYSNEMFYKLLILYSSTGFFISNYFTNQFSIYKETLFMLKLYPQGSQKLLNAHLLLNKLIMFFLFLLSLLIALSFPDFIKSKLFLVIIMNIVLTILYLPYFYMFLSIIKTRCLNYSQNVNMLKVLFENILLFILIATLAIITKLGIEFPLINASIFLVFFFLWIYIKKKRKLENLLMKHFSKIYLDC